MQRSTIALLTLTLGVVLLALPVRQQMTHAAQPSQATQEPMAADAIEAVLKRFARARMIGDVEAARACVHPEVVRRIATDSFWGDRCEPWVRDLSPSSLRFVAWQAGEAVESDIWERTVVVRLYEVGTTTATARIRTIGGDELVHLVRFDEQWLITDTLRSEIPLPDHVTPMPPNGGPHPDRVAIEAACREYALGFYTGDGSRVQQVCHSALSKRSVQRPTPRPGQQDGVPFDMMEIITYEEMDRLATFFKETFGFDPDAARKEVEVYYYDEHIACAKLTGASWFDYMHLVKLDGEWEIVNIVFESLPPDQWDTGE